MRIGLFGGSFNPIHAGHVALASQLLDLAGLDEVWLMVSPQNPLKQGNTDILDDQLRYQLARLALHGLDSVKASNYELHLPKPSYTWHTLEHLQQDYPRDTFTLLIGGDNWTNFRRWYRADDILKNYQVVVYPRRGSTVDQHSLPPSVSIADTELIDLSSTEVRNRVLRRESIVGMVPQPIIPLVESLYLNFSTPVSRRKRRAIDLKINLKFP